MALNKNSKSYQWLLDKWYTEAQIEQMANSVESGKTIKQAFDEVKSQPANPTRTAPTSTPTETPTTPAPVKEETVVKQEKKVGSTVPEIKQEWALKPQSQEYYNQTSDEALKVIKDNLNNYKQTNPEYFTDYESFKKNFTYNARTQEQKDVLDNFYNNYQKWLTLWATPVNDLYTQYKDGQISLADLELLKSNNPTKYVELQNQINKASILTAYDDTTPTTEDKTLQDMAYEYMAKVFNSFISGDYTSETSKYFEDYRKNMDSPEMLELQDKTTELDEAYKNIEDQIASISKDVEKEYEWTWATISKINAIIADRTYDLQQQLRTLGNEYNKYATQYNNRANQYQNEFQLQLQEYQINMQARNQQMNELGFAMDLMNFETNEQKAQREWDYWVKQQEYTNWNINSKDYQTRYKAALTSVQNLLSQYEWIPMQRSAEQMADDILKAIDNGSNLWAELTKINKQIQQKPEYKYLYNNTYKTTSSNWVIEDSFKVWDTEWYKYNGKRYNAEELNKILKWGQTWTAKAYDVVDESVLMNQPWGFYTDASWNLVKTWNNLWKFLLESKNLNGKTGWQCGKFVNDYLQYIGMTWATNRYYDDNLSTKFNSVNSYDPKVWTVAVFDYNHKSSDGINHGHVGIVTKVTDDGIWVRDSNYSSDEKIKTRFIAKDSAEWNDNLKGFFDPSKPPLGSSTTTTSTTTTLSDVDNAKKQNYLEEARRWKLTATETKNIWDLAAEQWWDEEWRDALNQGLKIDLTEAQIKRKDTADNRFYGNSIVKDFEDASVQINNLINSLNANNWAWDLAWIFQFMKVLDPSSVVREQEFKNAAASAWYAKPNALWQKYVKHGWDGTWLNEAQRGNFAQLAKELIKWQAEMYNFKYDALKKEYKDAWIDESALPENFANYILNKLDGANWTTVSTTTTWNNTIKSFKNNVTLSFANMPTLKVNTSTKQKLQSLYGVK